MAQRIIEILLEGKPYKFTVPLTLGQLEDLQVGVSLAEDPDPQVEARRSQQRVRSVILAAAAPENPTLTDDSLKAMRLEDGELMAAFDTILSVTGMKKPKPGEAPAGAA